MVAARKNEKHGPDPVKASPVAGWTSTCGGWALDRFADDGRGGLTHLRVALCYDHEIRDSQWSARIREDRWEPDLGGFEFLEDAIACCEAEFKNRVQSKSLSKEK